MENVLAVLDAVGSERASVFGISEGGSLAALLAATYPNRIASIIVYGTAARFATLLVAGVVHPSTGIGDDAWREVTAAYGQIVSDHLARFAGHRVEHVGSGMIASFDGPARAIRCALGILDAAGQRGIDVRVGVHTGESDVDDTSVDGIAVDIATAVAVQAAPGEVLVSSTVRDLVAGSGIRFGNPRTVEIKGVAGRRDVLPVLRHGLSPDATRRLAIEQADVLRRDGEYWTVAFDGHVATLRDTKGVRDLARLLAAPHQELHVLDLGAEAGDGRLVETRQATESDELHREHGSSDPILDDRARAEYKRRIDELQADVDEADRRGDPEASVRARVELDALVDELAAAYGLGGRPRRTPDRIERARKTVTRRIRDAIGRIERAHPTLGRHLQASIRTGVFCSYAPERDVRWMVQSDL